MRGIKLVLFVFSIGALLLAACGKNNSQNAIVEDYSKLVEQAMTEIEETGQVSRDTQAELERLNAEYQDEIADMSPMQAASMMVKFEKAARPLMEHYTRMDPQAQENLERQATDLANQYMDQLQGREPREPEPEAQPAPAPQ